MRYQLFLGFLFFIDRAIGGCTSLNGPYCYQINKVSPPDYFSPKKLSILSPATNFGAENIPGMKSRNNKKIIANSPKKKMQAPSPATSVKPNKVLNSFFDKVIDTSSSRSKELIGSYTMMGVFRKSKVKLDSKHWIQEPVEDWSAINLVGEVLKDMSIEFSIYSPRGEFIEECTSFIATFVSASNKAWRKGNPPFLKGTWEGKYVCNERTVFMELELDTVGTLPSGEHNVEGIFKFFVNKKYKVEAFQLDIKQDKLDLHDLDKLLEEIFEDVDIEELASLIVNLDEDSKEDD